MIAACFDTLEGWSLVVGRASVVGVGLFSLGLIVHMLRVQTPNPSHRMVPRPVLVFAGVWVSFLVGVTIASLVLGCESTATPLARTLFATALTWSLFGMAWVVYYGSRWRDKVVATHVERAKQLRSIAEEFKEESGGRT